MSIVRENIMTVKNYTPYCGSDGKCSWPRTFFNGRKFQCPECGWESSYSDDFIAEYKAKRKAEKEAQ